MTEAISATSKELLRINVLGKMYYLNGKTEHCGSNPGYRKYVNIRKKVTISISCFTYIISATQSLSDLLALYNLF